MEIENEERIATEIIQDVDFIPVSAAEAMNPSRRSTMEDAHSVLRPGTWNEKIPNLSKFQFVLQSDNYFFMSFLSCIICLNKAFLALYDGHGGRDLVEFIQHAMPFHVAQELDTMDGDEEARKMKVLRAFLMADIHARQVGITSSGAAVAICLVQVFIVDFRTHCFLTRFHQPLFSILLTSEHHYTHIAFDSSQPMSGTHAWWPAWRQWIEGTERFSPNV